VRGRSRSAWTWRAALALAAACSAAAGCGGGPEPRPTPAPRPKPAESAETPPSSAASEGEGEGAAGEPESGEGPESATEPAESAPKPTSPALEELTLRARGPEGSLLRFGEEEQTLKLPGELSLQLEGLKPCPVSGRLALNELAEALEIPSSASAHLHEDREGVWVEVSGRLLVGSSGAAEIEFGRRKLRELLAKGKLELGDGRRVRLRLTLE